MSEVMELSVIDVLEQEFEATRIVTKHRAWEITRLSSRSLSEAYFLHTNKCRLVQLDEFENIARVTGALGAYWVRTWDFNTIQCEQFKRYLPNHMEGTINVDEALYKETIDRAFGILNGKLQGW